VASIACDLVSSRNQEMIVDTLGTIGISVGILLFIGGLAYGTKHHKNFEKRTIDDEYLTSFIINLSIISSIVLIFFHARHILYNPSFFPRVSLLVFSLLTIDTAHYWIHRICHRTPALKKLIHNTHHDAYDLIPSDIFYMTLYDGLLYVMTLLVIPILLGVNLVEAFVLLIIALLHGLYIHSELTEPFVLPGFIHSSYHKNHHQIGKGNYAFLFPIWDDYMQTRIAPPADKQEKKDKIKEKE
jgi:sterol desaturase/sphingolipid hydroxylase (fatty acid hydroxylase superfamily)